MLSIPPPTTFNSNSSSNSSSNSQIRETTSASTSSSVKERRPQKRRKKATKTQTGKASLASLQEFARRLHLLFSLFFPLSFPCFSFSISLLCRGNNNNNKKTLFFCFCTCQIFDSTPTTTHSPPVHNLPNLWIAPWTNGKTERKSHWRGGTPTAQVTSTVSSPSRLCHVQPKLVSSNQSVFMTSTLLWMACCFESHFVTHPMDSVGQKRNDDLLL